MNYETKVKSFIEKQFAPSNLRIIQSSVEWETLDCKWNLAKIRINYTAIVNKKYPLAPIEIKGTLSNDHYLDV